MAAHQRIGHSRLRFSCRPTVRALARLASHGARTISAAMGSPPTMSHSMQSDTEALIPDRLDRCGHRSPARTLSRHRRNR
jgi:hypothetical protein